MGEGFLGITAGGWVTISGYALLLLAWWCHRRGDGRWAVVLLVCCAGLLRFGPSLDPCLHEWDERYHALVAKHLLAHPLKPTLYEDAQLPHDVGSWASGHVWLNKPPLSLWSIALSLKCFGLSPWAVRLPSLLLSMIAVALLHALARMIASRTVAFWAALLFAINGHLIELASGRTSNDHPDTFLLVFVLAALYAAVRLAHSGSLRWAVGCGVLAGLAFMSKAWPALLIFPVAFLFVQGREGAAMKRSVQCLAAVLLTTLLVSLPWNVFASTTFPEVAQAASAAHWRHFTVDIEEHGRPWTYYWTQLPMIHGELAPIALIWFVLVLLRERPRAHAALLVWWLLPYFVFSFAVTKMPAYTVIAAPAICIIIAMAFERFLAFGYFGRWRVAVLLVAAGLVLLPLRFSLDRTRPWIEAPTRYTIPATLLRASPKTVVINCPVPVELMFHTPVAAAYERALSDEIDQLAQAGYTVVDWRQLPN